MNCTLEDVKNSLPPTVCQSSDDELVKIFNSRLLPEMWSLLNSLAPDEFKNKETITIANPTTDYALPSDYGSLISARNQDCVDIKKKSIEDCCSLYGKNWYMIKGNNLIVSDETTMDSVTLVYNTKRPKITSITDPLPIPDWLCDEIMPALSAGMAYYYFKNNGFEQYIDDWQAEFKGKLAEVQDPVVVSGSGCSGCSHGYQSGSLGWENIWS